MPDEPIAREKAREAVRSGRLPATPPRRTVVGRSTGATCEACGDPVPRDEMEVVVEFRAGPPPEDKLLRDALERLRTGAEVRRYHLHQECFRAWESERTTIRNQSDQPSI